MSYTFTVNSDFQFEPLITVTIQGGGVFGISLLGQLQAIDETPLRPVVLAGSSAGALISSLYWIGYKPIEIRNEIQRLLRYRRLKKMVVNRRNVGEPSNLEVLRGLFAVLGAALSPKRSALARLFNWLVLVFEGLKSGRYVEQIIRARGLTDGEGVEAWLNELLRKKLNAQRKRLQMRQIAPQSPVTFSDVFTTDIYDVGGQYRPVLLIGVANLSKEDFLLVDSHSTSFEKMSVAAVIRASIAFPGFFEPKRLRFFRDKRSGRIASAETFEKEMEYATSEVFIDGGVVSNFPVWSTLGAVRRILWGGDPTGRIRTPAFEEVEREVDPCEPDSEDLTDEELIAPLKWLAFRPMVHIGCQIVNQHRPEGSETEATEFDEDGFSPEDFYRRSASELVDPRRYWGALFDFVTSSNRSRLETIMLNDLLSLREPRVLLTDQPKNDTLWNEHSMAFDKLTVSSAKAMFERGKRYGERACARIRTEPTAELMEAVSSVLRQIIASVIKQTTNALPGSTDANVRVAAGVFAVQGLGENMRLNQICNACSFGPIPIRHLFIRDDFEENTQSAEDLAFEQRETIFLEPGHFTNPDTVALYDVPAGWTEFRIASPLTDANEELQHRFLGTDAGVSRSKESYLRTHGPNGPIRFLGEKRYGVLIAVWSMSIALAPNIDASAFRRAIRDSSAQYYREFSEAEYQLRSIVSEMLAVTRVA